MYVLCCQFLSFPSSSFILTLFINISIYQNSSIKDLNITLMNSASKRKSECVRPAVQQSWHVTIEMHTKNKYISGQICTHTHISTHRNLTICAYSNNKYYVFHQNMHMAVSFDKSIFTTTSLDLNSFLMS